MVLENAIVRGSLPGCSRVLPSVTPFTASETPKTRVISFVVGARSPFPAPSIPSRRRRKLGVTLDSLTPSTITR